MATGSGPLGGPQRQGIAVSDITPTVAVPNVADDVRRATDALAQAGEVIDKHFEGKAAEKGAAAGLKRAQDISEGKVAPEDHDKINRPLLYGNAYEKAFDTATLVGLRSDIDAKDGELRLQYRYDPEGYKAAAAKAQSGFIQGAPTHLAVDVEAYAQGRFGDGHQQVAAETLDMSTKRSKGAIQARIGQLTTEVQNDVLGGSDPIGTYNSPLVQGKLYELGSLEQQLYSNPAFGVSKEEGQANFDKVNTSLKATVFTAHVQDTFRKQGYAAARAETDRLTPAYVTPGAGEKPAGMVAPGNIDLNSRPQVKNPDGSISTVRSMSIEVDGKEVLIPTVIDGKVVADQEAVDHYRKTGENLGTFQDVASANAYAQTLHKDQASLPPFDDLGMTPTERLVAQAQSREGLDSSFNASTAVQRAESITKAAEESKITKAVNDDIGTVEITGKGTDLKPEDVMRVLGPAGYAEWMQKRSDALQRYRQHGDLSGLSPDQASQRIVSSSQAAAAAKGIPEAINTPEGMASWAVSIERDGEHGKTGQISPKGARGVMQIMPDTAAQYAASIGEKFDPKNPADLARLANDDEFNRRLGHAVLADLQKHYGGDITLATAAYNAGPGVVDDWINGTNKSGKNPGHTKLGDPRKGEITDEEFAARIPFKETRDYVSRIGIGLGTGRAAPDSSSNWVKQRDDFKADPIGHAILVGAVNANTPGAAPLPDFETDPAGWAAGLKNRQALGSALATKFEAPPRILTNVERDGLAAKISANPAMAVQIAQAATQALGPDGARSLMRELSQGKGGEDTPMFIGALAVNGSANFANSAAEGMNLKAKGGRIESADADSLDRGFEPYRQAFSARPDYLLAARNVAELAMISDRARGIHHEPTYYVSSALGMTKANGNLYGGVREVNGYMTPIPTWLNGDRQREAMLAIGEKWVSQGTGPRYANGQALTPAEIARAPMRLLPNGRYALLSKTGQPFKDKDGGPFTVDLDGAKGFLLQRYGAGMVLE